MKTEGQRKRQALDKKMVTALTVVTLLLLLICLVMFLGPDGLISIFLFERGVFLTVQ